jgi:hypothetical protein
MGGREEWIQVNNAYRLANPPLLSIPSNSVILKICTSPCELSFATHISSIPAKWQPEFGPYKMGESSLQHPQLSVAEPRNTFLQWIFSFNDWLICHFSSVYAFPVVRLCSIIRYAKMIIFAEWAWTYEEAIWTYLQLLFQTSPGGTE